MIGHEDVSVDAATGRCRVLVEPVEIPTVVLVCVEAGLPVIAALDQVKWNVRQGQARAARHGGERKMFNA